MRTQIFASLLVVGAFGGVATADPKAATHAAADAAAHAAVIFGPARTLRTAAPFSGEATLVGESPSSRQDRTAHADVVAGIATGARHEPAPRPEPYLDPADVSALVAPHADDIQQCFVEGTRKAPHTSQLALRLVIGRNGTLRSLDAVVPGLSTKARRQISSCARDALDAVQFPVRRNETIAVLPYLFQRTAARDAGPQQSCWNAKGC